ncbi:hypothetical protein MKK42_24720 [Escherichia coli]|nr:hypothetical protein [Escherichia coli]MCI2235212.1 hypothetical protein [Escherichia coli]
MLSCVVNHLVFNLDEFTETFSFVLCYLSQLITSSSQTIDCGSSSGNSG